MARIDENFPAEIPIKVLGRNTSEFRDSALGIIRTHFPTLAEAAIGERVSRDGGYLSLTITVRFETRNHADAVYRALSAQDQILMVL